MKKVVCVGLVLSVGLVLAAVLLPSEYPDGLERVLDEFPSSADPALSRDAPRTWRDILLGAAGVAIVFTSVVAWGAFRRRGQG